jgi:amino acid adenylation domain-containing protein
MIKDAFTLLHTAKRNGINIAVKNGSLQLKLTKDKTIDPDLLQQIKDNKELLLEFLNSDSWKALKSERFENELVPFDRQSVSKIPLSFSQERLWFIHQMEGSIQYHMPAVLRLKGKLNVQALSTAFKAIVNRHEILRTILREEDGEACQVITEVENDVLNLTDGSGFVAEADLQQYIQAQIEKPFDLSNDLMVRASLISLNEEEHMVVVVMHHIASDGWSRSIFIQELVTLYKAFDEGLNADLPALPVQFADYAVWQRNYLKGEVLEKKIAYWKEKLQGISPLQLPLDYARPATQTSRGAVSSFRLESQVSEQMQALSTAQGTTLFMTLLAVFKVLLYRYSGQDDIAVGSPIAGRQQQELEGLIGFFINTLVLRTQVDGDNSFVELLQHVKATTLQAYEHQDVPFEKLVEEVVKERDPSRNPLFQVMFALQTETEKYELRLGDTVLSAGETTHSTSKFDLSFNLKSTPNGLLGSIEYNTDLYHEATIQRMADHFTRLLQSVIKEPAGKVGRLNMLSEAEQEKLSTAFNQTTSAYQKDKTVVDFFEHYAETTPDAIALVYDDQFVSYETLNEKSNKLAHFLRSKGLSPEELVPVCLTRSIEIIIAMLGVLKAGGAYVLIDPEYPQDRITYMLEDCAASLVITNEVCRQKVSHVNGIEIIEPGGKNKELIGQQPSLNPPKSSSPHQLIYVVYTSGSTGKPKGVMIEQQNVVNLTQWHKKEYNVTEASKATAMAGVAFDAFGWEVWPYLTAGASIHLINDEQRLSVSAILDVVNKHSITHCFITTALVYGFIEECRNKNTTIQYLSTGGEKLSASSLEGLNFPVYNVYGPAENTVVSTTYKVETDSHPPIGKPIANTQVFILSKDDQLVPFGVAGELCIGGDGLARAYLNQEELTKEKFVQNPANESSIIYKTGDLARWLPDGNIEYLGRIDDQIKIRGYRIELGEIESVLQENGQVKQAVVLAKEGQKGDIQLVAYVVAQGTFDRHALKTYLESKLPAYMVPALWVSLESLPLTANGKIDKKALPDPDINEQASTNYVAPRNKTEQKLADIWQELLGVAQPGVNDSFFELGGHSLLAMRLISAIRKHLEIELGIRDLFVYPTISALAAHLQAQQTGLSLPAIEVEDRPVNIPLSFAQERLWFIDQLEGSRQYHIPAVLNLKGKLDQEALSYTLQTIVKRHEVLRTVIREDKGQAHQFVLKERKWQLTISDGSIYNNNPERLKNYISNFIATPFILAQDYMLRAELIRLEPEEYILVATMHHIASDGWSTSLLVKEVVELYAAYVEKREASLSVLPIQYADYAIWQRKNLKGDVWESKLGYWKQKLEAVTPLQLTTDFVRPTVKSIEGAVAHLAIDEELSQQLKDLSNAQGGTLFITLLAAFKVLIFKHSGQDDICIGTPISGRTQHEVENLIGNFVNTLALRSSVRAENTFLEQLQNVWATTLEAYEYQDIPFEKIVEAVVKERNLAISPLFQAMFVLQNTPEVPQFDLAGIHLTGQNLQETKALFDLTLYATEAEQGLQLALVYNTDLYKPATIQRMLGHYETLLKSVVNNPESKLSAINILSDEEMAELERFSYQSVLAEKEWESITSSFREQAAKTPSKIALVFGEYEITYGELDKRSNRLAHYLIDQGVQAEQLVPVCMERGIEMIISILGILKSGAAYVPVDVNYPVERINYMLDDTGATLVLCADSNLSKLSSKTNITLIEVDGSHASAIRLEPETSPDITINSGQLAYIIYTSGSTGKPKGVQVEHRNVVSLVKETNYIDISTEDRLLVTGSPSFDATTFEYWGMLLNGGCLVMCKEEELLEVNQLKDIIRTRGVTTMWFTSSWFNQLIDTDINVFAGLKTVLAGGEKLSEPHVVKFTTAHPHIKLINGYGPTENTTFSLTHHIKSSTLDALIPIGRPLSNRTAFVLDQSQILVPIGVPGEICVGGAGLSRGYLNKPDLTAERFIANPFDSNPSRLYRTGDLGRWLPDGTLEYLGRIDDQLKIRGYRIEPGEIESVIHESGMARQAVVLGRADKQGNKRLIGYIIPEGDFDKEAFEAYVSDRLPDYMIPSAWVEVDKIPLTINGKTDVLALPVPDVNTQESRSIKVPITPLEKSLAAIWQDVLEVDEIGVDDDFFELGGHSLLAIRLVSLIRKELNFAIVIRDVFDYPTITLLAAQLSMQDRALSDAAKLKSLIQIKAGNNRMPLYIVSGGGGTVFKFKSFADMLHKDQPVYGIQQPTTAEDLENFPETIEGIAAKYTEEILKQNPDGPYALSGHCLGGTIAFEMTQQLEAMGKKVALLALFDTQVIQRKKRNPGNLKNLYHIPAVIKRTVLRTMLKLNFELFLLRKHTKQAILYKVKKLKLVMGTAQPNQEEVDLNLFDQMSHAFQKASVHYEMKPYNGDLLVFYAKKHYYFMDRVNKVVYKEINYSPAVKNAWNKYARSVTFYEIDGEHSTIFDPLFATEFSKILQDHLNQAAV